MKISNEKELASTIMQVKQYLLKKVQQEMGDVPLSKLKKSKMIISEGPIEPEEEDEITKIRSMLSKNKKKEEPVEEESMEEDADIRKIRASLMARKGSK